MDRGATLVDTYCEECEVAETWISRSTPNGSDWEPTQGESSFTCEHWRDHHEASHRAASNASGRARENCVRANRQLGSNSL